MLDFLMVSTRIPKKGLVEIYPKFLVRSSSDLMIRGGDFYAVWNEDTRLWSTEEETALYLIDQELDGYFKKHEGDFPDEHVHVMHMWDAESGSIDRWHKYVQKQIRDNYHPLDEKLIFSNTETKKTDYASKRLNYPLEKAGIPAWDELAGALYAPEERRKLEWAIGAIVAGESIFIQKFIVMYGAAGTGKSTILNIIQAMFDGYYSVFDAKALGSTNNAFALEAFKTNPLVAIQHDGDLSHIEDNTRLNSLVSHEMMTVNEKFKSAYAYRFNSFLFMGTNRPVRITDAKSGIIRRLIDVSPTGNKIPPDRYRELMAKINFELGGIAWRCREIYEEDPGAYDDYIPVAMLGASNDFYNFVLDSYETFRREDGITLKQAWELYKNYCEEAKVAYPYSQRPFKEELKNYFREFKERVNVGEEQRVRNYYSGFISDKFEYEQAEKPEKTETDFRLEEDVSLFDSQFADFPAQYANPSGTPTKKWAEVETKLRDISTGETHYVRLPENCVVIDFDLKDKEGKKSFRLNAEAARKWPPTYAELSKSGEGIHLHYFYDGDTSRLSRIFDEGIEIKVFSGNSSLRRKLTRCNALPIATINSGLPIKGEDKMINFDGIKSERSLRTLIKRNLNKEIHPATKPSVDFIFEILRQSFESGLKYDVTDLRPAILTFAARSTNNAEYCIKLVNGMSFKSEEPSENSEEYSDKRLIFFDVEVFPNLFVLVWKAEDREPVSLINPDANKIEWLLKYRLVGFNCRRYDNHILYARLMGYSNEQLYTLSQRIIDGSPNAMFGEAYNISYTDIYDFASSGNKKSLKKLEIEMGIHHQELGLPWDKPVDEALWGKVADYCINDVIATEAAFAYLKADWTARQILADLAGMSVNDTTNSLTQRIIFGANRRPQAQFNWRDLAQPVKTLSEETRDFLKLACPEMMESTHGDEESALPYFPGYTFEGGKSTYMGETAGEGGFVYSEPGMYENVALLDISSMHPHSAIAEVLFGVKYTMAFRDIVEGRVSIKHEAWDDTRKMLDGKLAPYIQKVTDGEMSSDELADALKTAINSVYGLTSASFENAFRDPRNRDNIVAKRGALFMINLKSEVQKRGFTVAHIKTDSIKIPKATPEIISFVSEYGKRFGYTFEHEATYERMCLVNDAVYIARYKKAEDCLIMYGHTPKKNKKYPGEWTATGTQFQIPYVFKTLFSREPIEFADKCETKTVSSALYLDMNEALTEDEHSYHFIGKTGQFCPIKAGNGGGLLMREKDGQYNAANGSKGYRWLESEMVKNLGKEGAIDESYYTGLCDEAVKTIEKYGDFEGFRAE